MLIPNKKKRTSWTAFQWVIQALQRFTSYIHNSQGKSWLSPQNCSDPRSEVAGPAKLSRVGLLCPWISTQQHSNLPHPCPSNVLLWLHAKHNSQLQQKLLCFHNLHRMQSLHFLCELFQLSSKIYISFLKKIVLPYHICHRSFSNSSTFNIGSLSYLLRDPISHKAWQFWV